MKWIKTFEFIRNRLQSEIKYIFIYSTSPIKKVIAKVKVVEIIHMRIHELWDIYNKKGVLIKGIFSNILKEKKRDMCINLER